uniref:Uncharacterized protein n=1 Tax=Trypanosoma vivax (strain Y486) TaxID=1055687 RepID=G0U8T4_TRYVY|nr:conserved hypothetical protein [Trypanosoma vivax Y486]
MGPMVLPYVDTVPSNVHLAQARLMVWTEASAAQREAGSLFLEKLQALEVDQRNNIERYNIFRAEMQALRHDIRMSLVSGLSSSSRKRPRPCEMTAEGEMLRFEGMLGESLDLELALNVVDGGGLLDSHEATVALYALQRTQEVLRDTRMRIEEVNAMRCWEQRSCAKTVAEQNELTKKRINKIRALEGILHRDGVDRRSKVLDSLE